VFTGIVETVGRVVARRTDGAGVDLEIEAPDITRHLAVGQSVATDGVCLTVTRHDARRFAVTAVPETLERTALGGRTVGARVNLERSLAIGDRLDGHLVQGHVDGVGVVTQIRTMSPGRSPSTA
jgi:riboflavin synthase